MMTTLLFRDRIRALREERGWSVRETARRMGVAEAYVRRLEDGDFLPAADRLELLAKTFAVPLRKMTDWLVADRLTEKTGEKAPGVNWFMRSLDDLNEQGQRQAISRLLDKLADRKAGGEAWPDEFQIRRKRAS